MMQEETKEQQKSTRQRLAEWSKTPEGRESYEKVAGEMRQVADESGSSELPNDLKEAAARFSKNVSDGHNYRDLRVGFIAGAEWQKEQYHFFNEAWADDMQYQLNRNYENGKQAMKEQMMKDAVECKVFNYGLPQYPGIFTTLPDGEYNEGDKVRIIILPKEE